MTEQERTASMARMQAALSVIATEMQTAQLLLRLWLADVAGLRAEMADIDADPDVDRKERTGYAGTVDWHLAERVETTEAWLAHIAQAHEGTP